MKSRRLIGFDEALDMTEKESRKMFKEYQNPGLAFLLEIVESDRQYSSASGVVVTDPAGNEYLDFLGGFGSLNLGHNHPAVWRAVEAVQTRPNILQTSVNPIAAALAHNLAKLCPGELSRSFFCNSGTEAVEGALKLARAATGKKTIVYCSNSFHGKSMGSLSVTGREKYQKRFEPLVPDCRPVPYGDAGALAKELDTGKDVAAFIVEPVQGEGGIIVPPEGYLRRAREICSKNGILLIVDEVQTGLGRTGKMFACEHEDVAPDVMCLAKSLGGGVMPLGAFITTPALWDKAFGGIEKCMLHTSTFGGNTRAAAAGLAAIEETLKERLPERAAEMGDYLLAGLMSLAQKHRLIKEVRGKGLMAGIEFGTPNETINRLSGGVAGKLSEEYVGALIGSELFRKHRVITAFTLNNPRVIRMEPPLIVTREQIDTAVDALDRVLEENSSGVKVIFSGIKTAVSSLHRRVTGE